MLRLFPPPNVLAVCVCAILARLGPPHISYIPHKYPIFLYNHVIHWLYKRELDNIGHRVRGRYETRKHCGRWKLLHFCNCCVAIITAVHVWWCKALLSELTRVSGVRHATFCHMSCADLSELRWVKLRCVNYFQLNWHCWHCWVAVVTLCRWAEWKSYQPTSWQGDTVGLEKSENDNLLYCKWWWFLKVSVIWWQLHYRKAGPIKRAGLNFQYQANFAVRMMITVVI